MIRLSAWFVLSAAGVFADCMSDLAEARRMVALQDLPRALNAAQRCRSAAGRVMQGNLLYLMGRDEQAATLLEALLKEEPGFTDAQYALGRVHYFNGRYDRARELFAAVVAKDVKHYRAWDNLGLALEGVGKPEEAIQAHLKAIALVAKDHPDYDWAYGNLAELLMKQDQQSKQAFNLAVEAAQRGPNNARNFYLAGKALTRLGEWEKSIRWSRRAVELDPEYAEAHYLLAMALRRAGQEQEARAEFERTRVLREKAPAKRR